MLLEVSAETPAVPSPTFLSARQPSYRDEARLDFFNHGPYDAIEVQRDCQPLAEIGGGATSFLDTQVEPGFHDYRVRGVRGGVVSDIAEAEVQIGRGAVLGRTFLWPARSPHSRRLGVAGASCGRRRIHSETASSTSTTLHCTPSQAEHQQA